MAERENSATDVKTSERVLDIIEIIHRVEEITTSELAQKIDTSTSTAHRHLKTLENNGYLRKEGEKYKIGLKFFEIGGKVRDRKNVYQKSMGVVDDLTSETNERVQLVTSENGVGYTLYSKSGERGVQTNIYAGHSFYLHSTAGGKSMLAEYDDGRINNIVEVHGLEMMTPETINSLKDLYDEIERIRDSGYAINRGERVNGLWAVGSSITSNKKVYGAVSISGPANRMSEKRIENELVPLLQGYVNEIELNLKY